MCRLGRPDAQPRVIDTSPPLGHCSRLWPYLEIFLSSQYQDLPEEAERLDLPAKLCDKKYAL